MNALQFGDVSVANGAITMHSDSRAYLLKNNVGSIGQDDFYQVGNFADVLSPIPNCIAISIPTRVLSLGCAAASNLEIEKAENFITLFGEN